ncbi:SH2 domain protein, partial [Cooperia oncophora]
MAGGQLTDQIWYWGSVDKTVVSEIMQDQPEGTFMVRDASSPGDFTLTVSSDATTRLCYVSYVLSCLAEMAGGQLTDQIWYWGSVDKTVVSE